MSRTQSEGIETCVRSAHKALAKAMTDESRRTMSLEFFILAAFPRDCSATGLPAENLPALQAAFRSVITNRRRWQSKVIAMSKEQRNRQRSIRFFLLVGRFAPTGG